jgi:hypothetical protein
MGPLPDSRCQPSGWIATADFLVRFFESSQTGTEFFVDLQATTDFLDLGR